MFRLVSVNVPRTVTHKLAQDFFTMKGVPGDRPLKESRVRMLRDQVAQRKFHTACWATVFCKETGEEYREDGKHTSFILSDLETPLDGIRVVISHFEADTLADVAALYATYNVPFSTRTQNEIITAIAAAVPELAALPVRMLSLAVQSIAFATFGCDHGRNGTDKRTREDRISVLPANIEFCQFLTEIVTSEGECAHLRRAPVGAAMYQGFTENPQLAREFWQGLRTGANPDANSVDRKLYAYLLRTKLYGTLGKKKEADGDRTTMYRKCMSAWKDWCETRGMKSLAGVLPKDVVRRTNGKARKGSAATATAMSV